MITGASGGEAYAAKYDKWRTSLVATLKQKLKYPDDHLFVLAEREGQDVAKATRENVRRVFGGLRTRLASDDLLFVILIGHGTTADNDEAKFNLVGPDLSSREWSEVRVEPFERATAYPQFTQEIEYDSYAHLVAAGVIPSYPEPRPHPHA